MVVVVVVLLALLRNVGDERFVVSSRAATLAAFCSATRDLHRIDDAALRRSP